MTNPQPPATVRSPELIAATQRVETAQTAYNEARDAWEAAAAELGSAKQRAFANHGIGVDRAALTALAEAEETARAVMQQAGEHLVQTRQAHHAAARAARLAWAS